MNTPKSPCTRPDIAAAIRGGDISLGMEDEVVVETADREQAIFWQRIYTEVLAMELSVADHMKLLMNELSPQSRAEVARTNLPVIEAQAEKFKDRLEFWNTRLADLSDISTEADDT